MSITEQPPGSPPTPLASIELAMEELRRLPRSEWLDLVRSDQSHRWRQGQAIAAEAYFQALPELRADAEDALVVINGEIMLRGETTDSPQLEDYRQRFPDLGDRIAIQFEVNRVLATPLDDTLSAVDDAGAPEAIQLPGYEFLDQIGSGASGVVYRARQQSLGRDVAIKVVPMPRADSRQIARQRQEAEVLARLRHPNVVHIYEVHEAHGCLHLVMEFVAGTTLAHRIKGRALAPDEAARLAQTLAEAVHAVHEAGVLHRDLKPANVLQSESGELKITDFGLAKVQSNSASLTAPDSILGTPSYMAPEQALGSHDSVGPAADVYSLGAILYEMLTGRPPFLGATVLDTLSLLRSEEPAPPRQLQPRLSRDLETICLKCLGKAPQQRYATAAALADDLRNYLSGMPIAARRPRALERAARWAKRRPAAAIAIACLFAVLGVVAAAWRINVAQQRRLSDAALVESIATADAQSLPQLLDRLPTAEGRVSSLIRKALTATKAGDPKWVNLSIAELAADPAASADALLAYLPSARPAEIRTITPVLAQQSAELSAELWRKLLAENATDEARLKLACLAAQISPADARWNSVAFAVSRALVSQHPLDISAFTTALGPARKALVPALVDLHGNADAEPLAREVAAGILARFASDDPKTLAELIVDADPAGFRLLLPALQEQAGSALPALKMIASKSESFEKLSENQPLTTRHAVQHQYDLLQRRRWRPCGAWATATPCWPPRATTPILRCDRGSSSCWGRSAFPSMSSGSTLKRQPTPASARHCYLPSGKPT